MQKLQTVNADTLLYEPLEKPSFVVDGLIPTGLTLFCGSQKTGKNWLIVIDTLQKVRTASKDNAYASGYGDISLIKGFAGRHSLAVIVIHHIQKQNDSDVFNKVSGTTGFIVQYQRI